MGTTIECWIEYDHHYTPPFSAQPECLPLDQWGDLRGNKDYRVYATLCGVRNETGIEPLYPLRGRRIWQYFENGELDAAQQKMLRELLEEDHPQTTVTEEAPGQQTDPTEK